MKRSSVYSKLGAGSYFSKNDVTIFLMALIEEGRAGAHDALCDWLFSNLDFHVYYLRVRGGAMRIDLNDSRHVFDIDFFTEFKQDEILSEKVVVFGQEQGTPYLIAA